MRICSVEGCDKKHFGKGYCNKHYINLKRHNNPLYVAPRYNHSKKCSVIDCNRKYYGKGYCQLHYQRFKNHGSTLYTGHERHGMTHSSEFIIWTGMIQRCTNKNAANYSRYGGRGITVCERWRNSFLAFYEDMGPRPFPEAQIDREKNDKGYYKSNCRWVTRIVNMRNRG